MKKVIKWVFVSQIFCVLNVFGNCESNRSVEIEVNPDDHKRWALITSPEYCAERTVYDPIECDPEMNPGPFAFQRATCELEICWNWMTETITHTACEGFSGSCPPDEHNFLNRLATEAPCGTAPRIKSWVTINCTAIIAV